MTVVCCFKWGAIGLPDDSSCQVWVLFLVGSVLSIYNLYTAKTRKVVSSKFLIPVFFYKGVVHVWCFVVFLQ